MNDPFDLQRFVDAQNPVFQKVQAELAAGAKTTHWMWFVFPQVRGLGRSDMAQRYAIASREEAMAYWKHPLLGARLKACTALVLGVRGRNAQRIFGTPDDLKFQSCMTLFGEVVRDEPMFGEALALYYGGRRDGHTLERL